MTKAARGQCIARQAAASHAEYVAPKHQQTKRAACFDRRPVVAANQKARHPDVGGESKRPGSSISRKKSTLALFIPENVFRLQCPVLQEDEKREKCHVVQQFLLSSVVANAATASHQRSV